MNRDAILAIETKFSFNGKEAYQAILEMRWQDAEFHINEMQWCLNVMRLASKPSEPEASPE